MVIFRGCLTGFEAYSFSTPFAFSQSSRRSLLENMLKVFESCPQVAFATCLVTHLKIRSRGFYRGCLTGFEPVLEVPQTSVLTITP